MKRSSAWLMITTFFVIISSASQAASLAQKKTALDSSISKEDRKIFAAARSCPVTKVQKVSFIAEKSFQVEVHRCDEDFSERFSKSLQGYSQTEFVLVFETGFKNPPLLAWIHVHMAIRTIRANRDSG
jgi:hypothetical protein